MATLHRNDVPSKNAASTFALDDVMFLQQDGNTVILTLAKAGVSTTTTFAYDSVEGARGGYVSIEQAWADWKDARRGAR